MDDVIEHGGPACEKYKEFFLPLLLSGLQSLQAEIRQASAYGWGVLAQFGGPNFAAACFSSIQYLVQMIQAPDARESSNISATENAIAAVTKILQYRSNNNEVRSFVVLFKILTSATFHYLAYGKSTLTIMVILASDMGR